MLLMNKTGQEERLQSSLCVPPTSDFVEVKFGGQSTLVGECDGSVQSLSYHGCAKIYHLLVHAQLSTQIKLVFYITMVHVLMHIWQGKTERLFEI